MINTAGILGIAKNTSMMNVSEYQESAYIQTIIQLPSKTLSYHGMSLEKRIPSIEYADFLYRQILVDCQGRLGLNSVEFRNLHLYNNAN